MRMCGLLRVCGIVDLTWLVLECVVVQLYVARVICVMCMLRSVFLCLLIYVLYGWVHVCVVVLLMLVCIVAVVC